MNLTPGLKIIKEFEGCRLHAYQDIVGVWTIGWGRADSGVHAGMTCTQAQADTWLLEDAQRRAAIITPWITVPVNDNQFGALLSFAYNIGLNGLHHSSLLTRLNARASKEAVGNEFLKYNHAGGKVVAGLTRRRKAEQALFIS